MKITPSEFVQKMLEAQSDNIDVVLGSCSGMETDQGSGRGNRKIVGVKYVPRGESEEEQIISADAVVVSAGPWSCAAEDWFQGAVQLPMEGVKSTSIVWAKPEGETVDATALFCGEDDRFGTHCKSTDILQFVLFVVFVSQLVFHSISFLSAVEVYPRPNGEIYICGIGKFLHAVNRTKPPWCQTLMFFYYESIGGSDYISTKELKAGAFLEECNAKETRVEAAKNSFQQMSSIYRTEGQLERVQACMRPCPPDARPYMGSVPGYEGAYLNAGHNCWGKSTAVAAKITD